MLVKGGWISPGGYSLPFLAKRWAWKKSWLVSTNGVCPPGCSWGMQDILRSKICGQEVMTVMKVSTPP